MSVNIKLSVLMLRELKKQAKAGKLRRPPEAFFDEQSA
jgi:hypothetical protein